MIWATEAHVANKVRRRFQRNPFHQASSKMYAPMTLESLKMPFDSMTCALMTSVCKTIINFISKFEFRFIHLDNNYLRL